jgi:putative ABC transport system permease protein
MVPPGLVRRRGGGWKQVPGRAWGGVEMALGGVAAGGVRSFLTVLGVAIGVASVVSLLGIGQGARRAVVAQFEGLGANIITVESDTPWAPLHAQLAPELAAHVPGIVGAVPVVGVGEPVTWRSSSDGGQGPAVLGVTPALQDVHPVRMELGSFLSGLEEDDALDVAVLGAEARSSLFGILDPIGQDIYIGRRRFRVIGVLAAGGGSLVGSTPLPSSEGTSSTATTTTSGAARAVGLGASLGDSVLIPASTAELLTNTDEVSAIWLKAASRAAVDPAVLQIERFLAVRFDLAGGGQGAAAGGGAPGSGAPPSRPVGAPSHTLILPGQGGTAISVQSLDALVHGADAADRTLSLMLAAIAAVSLVVGGIGVMNIMLVAVRERTVEIGLRKALGALQVEIIYQFLIEAVVLCAAGGALGWLGGYGGMSILRHLGIAAVPVPGALALALAAATGVGLIFGSYPAFLASELEPVEAIRRA